jgi:acyl transferase domain-containing protein
MQKLPTPVVSAKPNAALARQRKKLTDELADARNSLEFFQTSLLYTDDTRPAMVAQVAAKIAELEKQLQQVGA